MDARRRPGPADVVEAKNQYLAAALALSGEFDAQIKEMQEEGKKLEESRAIAATLAAAEHIRLEAAEHATARKAEADALLLKVQEEKEVLAVMVKEVEESLKTAVAQKEETQAGWASMDRDKTMFERLCERRKGELDQREAGLAEKEQQFQEAIEKVQRTQQALEARLHALAEVE